MKKYLSFVISLMLIFGFSISVHAAPEDDYPNFYLDVSWSIPVGQEAFTIPTRFSPSTDGTTGHKPFCKQADCSDGFKSIHEYIRDYTEDIIAGADTPRDAAERIFYEVRDGIANEDIGFFGAYMAYKYRRGNAGMKASLANAMYRAAKIPARLVIQKGQVRPRYLGYNAENHTSLQNDSTLDQDAFGSVHIYGEVYLGGQWVASDPAWGSDLADAFKIARFGEALKSFKKGGAKTVSVDYPEDFLAEQDHPYLVGENLDPVSYNEDMAAMKYLYFKSRSSALNKYFDTVNYRSTSKSLEGVCLHGIAELQEIRDLLQPGSADFLAATHAKDSLKNALKDLSKGKKEDARVNVIDAENSLRQISIFWDDMDLLTLRYRLAGQTHQGVTAVLKGAEANPPTFDAVEPYDNVLLNWQVLYGYDEWDDPEMQPYIMENLYIGMYGMNGVPMKINTITEDSHTLLFDPTNPKPMPMDVPDVLVDYLGNHYDPTTIPYAYDGPMMGYGPFLNSDALYSIPGANGMSDFFEGISPNRMSNFMMQGGREWQRERQWIDDMNVANRFLDTYPDVAYYTIWAMDNQVTEEHVQRIADSGAVNMIFDPSNSLEADFTNKGYEWEVANYVAGSSNPDLNVSILPQYGKHDVYIKGIVDSLEAEMENYPDGSRVVVGMLSHGFPFHDLFYTALGYPGCTNYWLPGSPYECPDMSDPTWWLDENLRQAGVYIWPTGYIYAEDVWHMNNWSQFDLIIAEITNNNPALFAKLDSNSNGVIRDDELWQIQNMFSAGDMDPNDVWAEGSEMFGNRSMADGMGGWIDLPPYLKEKIDTEGEQIDYFVDLPYYWGIEMTETIMQRHMLFPMDMGMGMGGMDMSNSMIWWDDNMRSEVVFNPADYPMLWGAGYDPINVVVPRMITEWADYVSDAKLESYEEAMSALQ